MRWKFLLLLLLAFAFNISFSYAQAAAIDTLPVTVTSKDSVNCLNLCTTLYSTVVGDSPINAGVDEDDVYSAAIPIGFTFSYWGINYTSCELGANGTIDFNAGDAGGYDPWEITAALAGNPDKYNNICGPWCDIDIFYTGSPIGSERYSTDGVAPYRKFVITWCGCSMYSCPSQLTTSQIILYETTNIIEVHLANKDICTDWNPSSPSGAGGRGIIGVEAPESMGGTAVVAPGRDWTPVWSAVDEAWRFTPVTDTTTGAATYTVTSIPYAPVPFDTSARYWYNVTAGTYLGTGDSITVCPTTNTLYKCAALGCSDSSFGYYYIGISIPSVTASISNPSRCGSSDGSIILTGADLIAGYVDTVNYDSNGVAKGPIPEIVSPGGVITLNGITSGNYTNITVTQDICTTAPVDTFLTNPPISISSVTVTNPSLCYMQDGALTLHGLYPGDVYIVNYDSAGIAASPLTVAADGSGDITIPDLGIGIYSNIIAALPHPTDSCITPAAGPDTLVAPYPPTHILSSTNPTLCGSSDATITIGDFAPFSTDTVSYYYNGTQSAPFVAVNNADSDLVLTGLPGGNYATIIVTIGQCVDTVLSSITIDSPIIHAVFDTSIHLGCHGDTVFLNNTSASFLDGAPVSTSPMYYVWNFGDGSVNDTSVDPYHVYLTQGSYTVTLVADDHMCWDTVSIPITLNHPLFDSFAAVSYDTCQNMVDSFTNFSYGTPGALINYNWYFGDGGTSNLVNPKYTYTNSGTCTAMLVVSDYVPCYDTFTATVQIDTQSQLAIVASDTAVCEGSTITLNGLFASLGYTGISWYTGNGGDSIVNTNPLVYAYPSPGTFTLSATAYYRACASAPAAITIHVFTAPTVNLGPDTSICAGSTAITLADNINSGTAGATWLWNTGQTTSAISVNTSGTYYVTVGIDNCYASDSVTVTNDCYMDIPNAFTPNNDGVNDYFYPRQELTKGLISFKMDIYNRWGELIFETTSLDGVGWDGKFNGANQPEGVYVYIIDGTFKDGEKEHHQGNVTLLR